MIGLILLGLLVGWNADVFSANLASFWDAAWTTASPDGTMSVEALSGIALLAAIGVAMVGSLFSSDAWNNITFAAGEVVNPKRTIPLSLFLGTATVTVLYLAANLAYIGMLPVSGMPAGADAARAGDPVCLVRPCGHGGGLRALRRARGGDHGSA